MQSVVQSSFTSPSEVGYTYINHELGRMPIEFDVRRYIWELVLYKKNTFHYNEFFNL